MLEHPFDPLRVLKLVRRWALLVLFMALLGGGLAFLVARNVPPVYEATGLLRVAHASSLAGQGSTPSTDATATDAALMTQDAILDKVNADLHLGETADRLRSEVKAIPGPSSELITVTVDGPIPSRDAAIANAIMSEYSAEVTRQTARAIDQAGASLQAEILSVEQTLQQDNAQLVTLQRAHRDTSDLDRQIQATTATLTALTNNYSAFRAQEALGFDHVTVAAPAPVPSAPINQHRLTEPAVGGAAGLLIGTAIAVVLQMLDQGLRTEDDVRQKLGIPVLGVVPNYSQSKRLRAQRRTAAAGEAYRRLRTSLMFSSAERPLRSLVVTSARVGEGKTRTSANLAGVLAAAGTKVLLIDADMRRPSQHRVFEREAQTGMSELLLTVATEGAPPNLNGALKTEFPNLSLLTAGTIPPNPAELLASRSAEHTLRWLEHNYDLVIIDTPPADVVTDAMSLAAEASATIIVIEAGRTDARQLRQTIDRLRELGANVVGVVLNKSRREPPHDHYDYYQLEHPPSPLERFEQASADRSTAWVPMAEPR